MNKRDTVHNWRKEGNKVRVFHYRLIKNGKCMGKNLFTLAHLTKDNRKKYVNRVWPCGGSTKVEVTTTDGKNYSHSVNCYHKDNYNKRIGIAICLGKIRKDIMSDKTYPIGDLVRVNQKTADRYDTDEVFVASDFC